MTIYTGTAANDSLIGTSGDDELYGLEGDDILEGGDGNDILDGGTGADLMTGGSGDDVYHVDDSGDVVVEEEWGGWDEVRLAGSYVDLSASYVESTIVSYAGGATVLGGAGLNWIDGGSGNDWFEGGGGDDLLSGNLGDDHLDGGDGDDELDGGVGSDTMIGGAGNDTYRVQQSGDVVTEAANAGIDNVLLSLSSYTLPANVENVDARYVTGGSVSITGNALNNFIIMGYGAVSVNGGAGNDTVSYQSNGAVTVDLTTWVNGGAAADDTLTGIENLTGSSGDDELRGNGSANILDGALGADTLVGRAGSDIYYVDNAGDVVVEVAGGGNYDEVRVRDLAGYTLPDYVEKLTSLTNAAFTGTGNGLANEMNGTNAVDTFYGGAGADALNGGAGNDVLYGEGDHDILNGGSGNDTMTGGLGNDTYIVDSVGDVVIEIASGGIDQVYTTLTPLARYRAPQVAPDHGRQCRRRRRRAGHRPDDDQHADRGRQATIDQIRRCEEAGATSSASPAPTSEATAALKEIVRAANVPIVADIHFHYKRALEAADAGAACLRINPGNIGSEERVAKSSRRQGQRLRDPHRRQCRQPREGPARKIWRALPRGAGRKRARPYPHPRGP
jgi:Ca2+-binding RTX toxin-like protein